MISSTSLPASARFGERAGRNARGLALCLPISEAYPTGVGLLVGALYLVRFRRARSALIGLLAAHQIAQLSTVTRKA